MVGNKFEIIFVPNFTENIICPEFLVFFAPFFEIYYFHDGSAIVVCHQKCRVHMMFAHVRTAGTKSDGVIDLAHVMPNSKFIIRASEEV